MQTQPVAQVGLISGATQSILLTADQIRVGVFMTGLAANFLHEVVQVEGGVITTQIHPKPAVPMPHTHAFTQMANTGCLCGLRKHPVAVWMSENRETPRSHIITPTGHPGAPEPYTVYGVRNGDGTVRVIGANGAATGDRPPAPSPTNNQYPLFTRAVKLWSLPERGRRVIEERVGVLAQRVNSPDPIDD